MPAPPIEIRGLTRTFGRHRGVVEVDLTVEKGEVFGFLGPNGAGKSTTIRILMGLYAATSGSARIFGSDVGRMSVDIRSRTGYLPGDLVLYPRMTGRELLDRFGHVRGLRDTTYRDELVERFDVDLTRPVHTLSKGNKQKIGVVNAFMHRPELLVLDEPTDGLDPLLQNEFAQLLAETAGTGGTVFLSSHDLDEVQRVVHRLAIIKDGRIVVTDTVDGLRAHAPRTIELTFDHDVHPSSVAGLPGVVAVAAGPRQLQLTLTGPVAPVLRAVALLDPIDLRARPADLDELFLGYYRSADSPEASRAH
ncbi:MAG: ABC transporter ATP-binding protein [Nakamurella sp.]